MQKSNLIIGLIFILLLVTGGVLYIINSKSSDNPSEILQTPPSVLQHKSNTPTIVSTKPQVLDQAVIPANQIIEITFSRPLENEPEFKRRFDPEIEYKVVLSSDRKTVRFIPEEPFELGVGYTLFILPDTKFEGGGRLDNGETFHFSTIKYRGV